MNKTSLTSKIINAKRRSEKKRLIGAKYRENQKNLVFNHYGRICSCCGESKIEFLSIDHLYGGGSRHAKNNSHLYNWIIRNNFPNDFRTLCMNCNWGRRFTKNNVCPHIIQECDI